MNDNLAATPYDPYPRYEVLGGPVESGWDPVVGTLEGSGLVVALDGPAILDWGVAVAGLETALAENGVVPRILRMSDHFAPWPKIVERTTTPDLGDDPDFARIAQGSLQDLFEALPDPDPTGDEMVVVVGPGAALVSHDLLWYVDLPKRYAEVAVGEGTGRNLGQPEDEGPGTTKRLFYIDWPLLDRHRDELLGSIDHWIDVQDPETPVSVDGGTLRRTLAGLARRPFRTRPTFNSTPWGGHWGHERLGLGTENPNTALGYELIAPESGVLLGEETSNVEVPFQLVVAQDPVAMMGSETHDTFGASFPIRFDYLDTMGGGNLSVHCHPRPEYMTRVFGWDYTQHETYYIMVSSEGSRVFLGLRDDVDLDGFHQAAKEAAENGQAFEIDEYVQSLPAAPHQLFMIPAGTPHGSSEGNVVLEVSATPYLYSLRFYDWLRRDDQGKQRPVHVGHAFANLDPQRQGEAVRRDLVQEPEVLRSGDGWLEERIGAMGEMFFEVFRMVLESDQPATDDTAGRFHVLNVVEGDGVVIDTVSGHTHQVNYAETIVVPASTGAYHTRRLGTGRVRVVKAQVR